jgi:3-mercaptopyruvate sulfurtransferase SseA
MSKTKLIFSLSALLLSALACNFVARTPEPTLAPTPAVTSIVEPTSESQTHRVPLTEAEVPRVPLDVAKAAIDTGEAVVVDVRSAEAYQSSHIPGAISIPLADIEANPTGVKLDKDQWIITYCT